MNRNETVANSTHDVLRLFFENPPMDQVEASRRLSITRAACSLHFQKLASGQYIRPAHTRQAGRGRPTRIWELDRGKLLFAGLAVENDLTAGELVDGGGRTLAVCEKRFTGPVSRASLTALCDAVLEELLEAAAACQGRVNQLFFSTAGTYTADGTISNAANRPELNGWQPEAHFEEKFALPAFSDSLGGPVIMGETDDCPPDATVALLDWSDGFGAVFACNGQRLLWPVESPGRKRALWDVGHYCIERDGRPCRCGRRGCLEAYVGGLALAGELGGGTSRDLASRAASGEEAVVAGLRRAAEAIIDHLYPALELFGVEVIIFTNTLAAAFPFYQESITAALHRHYPPEELQRISVRHSLDGEARLRHGAALCAREYFFYPEKFRPIRGMGIANKLRPNV